MNAPNNEPKKVWKAPALVEYGNVAQVTGQTKWKTPGADDDFNTPGIQDPS